MIFQRQYEKILAEALYSHLLKGHLPNLQEISDSIRSLIGKGDKALYQYVTQPSRAVFQNQVYNKGVKQIKFDITTLHEELLDLISKSNDRISYADLYHKVHISELRKLEADLQSLLFTIQNADFYFLGAYDNFNDVSKLDKEVSTSGIINLSESCIALPYGGKNTKKINTSHLYDQNSWPIKVNSTGTIISSRPVAGTRFGNIFTDLNDVWVYEVITDSQAPVNISFTFPLAGSASDEIEVLISRIQIQSHSTNTQHLLLETSNDNVNFITPLGYEEGIFLYDQRTTYALDFETSLVQYVRLTLSKNSNDGEVLNNNQYKYIFGLNNFSAFAVGRIARATYQSLPFDFSDNEEKISRISLESNSQVFRGTKINYSVALSDGVDIVTPFIAINPINEKSKTLGVPTVVNFNTTADYSRDLTIYSTGDDAATEYGSSFQGKVFYKIGDPISPAPIFNTAIMYRGFDCWSRDTSNGFKVIDIDNNYITFEHSDNESVYVLAKEIAFAQNQVNTSSTRKVQLTLTHPIYYQQSKGHLLKPPDNIVDQNTDNTPNYAVYKVLLNSSILRESKSFSLSSQLTQLLPVSSFILQSSDATQLPELALSTGQILRVNIDYILETENIGGRLRPTGQFTIPSTSSLLNANGAIHTPNLILVFTYTNESDITYKVSSINDNFIILDNITVDINDSIEVQYRYVPIAPNEIIKPSIRVANSPLTSTNRIFYVEGVDYIINITSGLIQRLPTGSIPVGGAVYVEFSYRSSDDGIQTFQTWCNITDTVSPKILFDLNESTKKNKLIADLESGEGFFVNTPQGLIELTNAISTPVLSPGWVQFIVRSKNPTGSAQYGTNLIDQVIQLRDNFRRKIFRSNNQYFKQILAFRDPMIQVTLNHLKVNTLKSDHSVFAVDNTTDPRASYIVLNFLPTSTPELYCFGPTADSDITSSPQTFPEKFLFQWRSVSTENNSSGNKIIVRIDLERDDQTDGSITPKVFDYKLRAST